MGKCINKTKDNKDTVMSTPNTFWDFSTGTAVCCCRTQNKPPTGWNWRQSEICRPPSMLSASYISLMIRRCMTLMMASDGWSEQLETGAQTLPTAWERNT